MVFSCGSVDSLADAGGSSVTRDTHVRHVWAPIQIVLLRNLAKGATLTSPSQLHS